MKADGIHCSPHTAQGKSVRSARRSKELQHNNGMHPTGHSADVIRQLGILFQSFRRVMPGVMSPHRVESRKIPAAPQLNAVEVVDNAQGWLNDSES
jgi:hypothetical protein